MGNACWMDGVIATTAVVALAVIAQVALRSASALLRHSVWRISLVAFWGVPAAILLVGSLRLQPRVVEIPMPRVPHAATMTPAAEPAAQVPAATVSDAQTPGTTPAQETHRHLTVASLRLLAVPALLLLWAVGAAVGIERTVRHLMLLRKLARDSEPIDDPTYCRRGRSHGAFTIWKQRVGGPNGESTCQLWACRPTAETTPH